MAGELLGLLVGWALIFALPVGVAWAAIRAVVTVQEALEKRQAQQRVPASRGDVQDTDATLPETESDSDMLVTDLDTEQGMASADSLKTRENR